MGADPLRGEMGRWLNSSQFESKGDLTTDMAGTPNQLTIFFDGEICVLNDIPPERAQAILIIAAATAAAAASPPAAAAASSAAIAASATLTRSPSFQSSSAALQTLSPQKKAEQFSSSKGSHLKLPEGLPLVRRSSLQQFLEKRRDRLVSCAPYCPPAKAKGETGGISGSLKSTPSATS